MHAAHETGVGRRPLTGVHLEMMLSHYHSSYRRLLCLDYDGTLVPFAPEPQGAVPGTELLALLERLSGDGNNTTLVVSGRDRQTLQRWLGALPVGLVAEHGAWVRPGRGQWRRGARTRTEWKEPIRRVLNDGAAGTPGSLVEEKMASLAWHYRQSDPLLAERRLRELKAALEPLAAEMFLGLLEGNRVLEVREAHVHKGRAVARWLSDPALDFVLAIGDDTTDEDMFRALPETAYTVKVGSGPSAARFSLDGPNQVRCLLAKLAAARGLQTQWG